MPSASVAVVRRRDTIVMRGYGYADIGTHRRAGPATVYEMGWITKQFTASAIMRRWIREARHVRLRARYSLVTAYSFRNGTLVPADYLRMTHPFAAGALCTSVRDFLMTAPDTLLNGRKLTYGFGLGVGVLGTHQVISHGGGINGFTTSQLFVRDDTLSVIVFTNADAAPPDPVAMNIARAVLSACRSSRHRSCRRQ